MTENGDEACLLAEVERALVESREALGALAARCRLAPALMSISTLIDRITVQITCEDGESAFELREEEDVVAFRASTLRHLISETDGIADEIGIVDSDERSRVRQLAINLFIIHELLHVRQNFPHFATVKKIKVGFEGIGLPMLDLAADTVSAWVCAHVEAERLGQTEESDMLRLYVNALILAYVIGAFVYDSRSKPGKRQRVLGLIVAALLVQAKVDGTLDEGEIYDGWQPMSPVMVLNLDRSEAFNAIVIDKIPGLLLNDAYEADTERVIALWESVGRRPVFETLRLAGELLIQMRAIKP